MRRRRRGSPHPDCATATEWAKSTDSVGSGRRPWPDVAVVSVPRAGEHPSGPPTAALVMRCWRPYRSMPKARRRARRPPCFIRCLVAPYRRGRSRRCCRRAAWRSTSFGDGRGRRRQAVCRRETAGELATQRGTLIDGASIWPSAKRTNGLSSTSRPRSRLAAWVSRVPPSGGVLRGGHRASDGRASGRAPPLVMAPRNSAANFSVELSTTVDREAIMAQTGHTHWGRRLKNGKGKIGLTAAKDTSRGRLGSSGLRRRTGHDARGTARRGARRLLHDGALGRARQRGHVATSLDTNAAVTLAKVGDEFSITRIDLTLKGVVPGISDADFKRSADDAKQNCIVSRALSSSVQNDPRRDAACGSVTEAGPSVARPNRSCSSITEIHALLYLVRSGRPYVRSSATCSSGRPWTPGMAG